MSQPKNAESAAAARRVPSTYASKGIGPEPAKSGDGLQSAVYCDFETVFESATLRLKEEQRYRTFVDLERMVGRLPCAVWHSKGGPREVTIWCSNDYLGMSQSTVVVQAMVDAARRLGTGSGGTRNIAGTNHPLVELERELADLHAKQAALVFTSGYVANQSSISTIAKLIPNCLILSDELNHNSMIEGVNQSNCAKQIFRHNDLGHILPLMVGDSEQCQKASALLLEEHAIYIQPINYPTVPKGAERLRITPSPFHTDSQSDHLVEALVNVWDRLGLWR